ncbi:MAG TPA: ABC transporter ATP-binding protein [Rhodopila sp.]|uniref:ABC transporter ATP-binding protein n=1 Tax=Rhodopila sp. TaxID=2480087 RepID=UPI002C166486|nr:ABC transporter ATP-binding protein [Rhodopila sp.]HVY14528.1 ABC transporter ATP-binding protein [Rhodopila sp.]
MNFKGNLSAKSVIGHGKLARAGVSSLMSDLTRIWPILADRRAVFAGMVALGLAASVLEAAAVSLISVLLYLSLGGGGASRLFPWIQDHFDIDLNSLFQVHFWFVCAAVVATLLLRAAAVASYGVVAVSLKSLVFHRLRLRLYQRFMFAPHEDASQASFGFITNTLQVEAPRVAELIDQLFRMPINACGAGIFFVVLLLISWPVACLTAIAGLALALLMQVSRVYLHRLGQRILALNEDLASRMLSGIQALRTIRAFGAEGREFDRFADASKSVARMAVRFAAVENVVTPSTTLAALGMIGAVVLFSHALGNGSAETLTIVALLFRLQPQIQGLQSSLTSIHGLESSLGLVVRVITEQVPAQPPARSGRTPLAPWDSIRFDNVSYRHPTSVEPTLNQLSFEIPRGLVTAIVGQSGAGKTTILNLLLRLTEPSEGAIEVDGVPLSSIDRLAWLGGVAITGQDIDVMNGTVIDNLRLGRPDLSAAEAMEALTLAGIADFIGSLPDGLETKVGERGHRLSGGQRQRIALARALAMKPRLLILDEATNAVDAKLEATILQDVRSAFPDATILIVAHRGSALSDADVVIDIAEGRVRSIHYPHQTAIA